MVFFMHISIIYIWSVPYKDEDVFCFIIVQVNCISSLSHLAVLLPCASGNNIYTTHVAQTQTVILISLMNMSTQKDTQKSKAALVHNKQPQRYAHVLTGCVFMMLNKREKEQ